MSTIQQLFLRQSLWAQALILTLTACLALFVIGFVMARFRHLVIEGFLARLIGAKAAVFAGYYLTVIGTLHHELAHALGYLLTGGRVHKISVLPKSEPDGTVRLGYVASSTRGPLLIRAIQDTVGSTAPLLFGFLTVWMLWRFALPNAGGPAMRAFICYAIVSILLHMELSAADLKLLRRGLLPTLLIVYVLVFLILRFLT